MILVMAQGDGVLLVKSQILAGGRGLGKLSVDVITCRFDVRNDEEIQQGEEEALFCTLCNVNVWLTFADVFIFFVIVYVWVNWFILIVFFLQCDFLSCPKCIQNA
ncbi:hypothetical protein Hanom_Chr04g00335911 [Helianthus anomalus]